MYRYRAYDFASERWDFGSAPVVCLARDYNAVLEIVGFNKLSGLLPSLEAVLDDIIAIPGIDDREGIASSRCAQARRGCKGREKNPNREGLSKSDATAITQRSRLSVITQTACRP